METRILLIAGEHPPPPIFYKKIGLYLPRIFLKVTLFLIILLSLLYLPHLNSRIRDFTPGMRHLIPGFQDEREQMIREILAVLDKQQTDLAGVTKEALADVIYEEASRYHYDPKFILAFIAIESSFRNWSVSERGAKGLMQIMPYVAESLAPKLGIEWMGDRTLFNPFLNIKMGIYYFSQLILDFDDLGLAVTAYNYGPTYVKGLIQRNEKIPVGYYQRVLNVYHTL